MPTTASSPEIARPAATTSTGRGLMADITQSPPGPCSAAIALEWRQSPSHTFFDQSNALLIHYTGTASTATISITSTTLALTTSLGENHTIDLTASPNNFLLGLKSTILGYGTYTVTVDSGLQTSNPFSTSPANVTSQDIKASAYQTVFDQHAGLVTNEVTRSVNWFLANITGMTSVQTLVYPGGSGSESPTVRSIVNSLGLVLGARSVVTTYSQDLSNVTIDWHQRLPGDAARGDGGIAAHRGADARQRALLCGVGEGIWSEHHDLRRLGE